MPLMLIAALLLAPPAPSAPPELASFVKPVVTAYLAGVMKNPPPNAVYLRHLVVRDSCVLPEHLAVQALSLVTDDSTWGDYAPTPYGTHCVLTFEEAGKTVYVLLGLHNQRAFILHNEHPGTEKILSYRGAVALYSLFEEVFPGLDAQYPGLPVP